MPTAGELAMSILFHLGHFSRVSLTGNSAKLNSSVSLFELWSSCHMVCGAFHPDIALPVQTIISSYKFPMEKSRVTSRPCDLLSMKVNPLIDFKQELCCYGLGWILHPCNNIDMSVLANQPYLHQLCMDTGYNIEDLLGVMNDRDGW